MSEREEMNEISGRDNAHERQDDAHERWRAMQAAYDEYVRASEALDNTRNLTPGSSDLEHLEVTLMEGRRDAFERYLETRLEFLEQRFDEGNERQPEAVSTPTRVTGRFATGLRQTALTWALPIFATGLLSMTVFTLVREQRHVRDLEMSRDQLQVTVSETRQALQLLAMKLDARETTENSAVHRIEHVAQPAVTTPRVETRKPQSGWRRVSDPPVQRGRSYYNFSLSRSAQLKRVGPIAMSVRSVDVRGKSVDVSIVSPSGKVDVQRVKLNQPVRIRSGKWEKPLELVVDRITANGLSGRLIELRG
jgi:hypothetical protein